MLRVPDATDSEAIAASRTNIDVEVVKRVIFVLLSTGDGLYKTSLRRNKYCHRYILVSSRSSGWQEPWKFAI